MNIPSAFHFTIFPKQDTPDSSPNSTTLAYQQAFYSRTIKEWYHLPTEIIEQENLSLFTHITIELIKSL